MKRLLDIFRRFRGISARLDQIAEDMYYEQAERDGCEYPPQWRG